MLSRRNLLSLALALPAGRALAGTAWQGALVMGTGRPGGDYEGYGTEWGSLSAKAAGVDIAFRASGGAAANILLIEQNMAQLGMTTLSVAEQARQGSGAWTAGVKFQEFRALFPMFPSVLQIVSPQADRHYEPGGAGGAGCGGRPRWQQRHRHGPLHVLGDRRDSAAGCDRRF